MTDQQHDQVNQARVAFFDQMMVVFGSIALYRAMQIYPEKPAVLLGFAAATAMILGGVRLIGRWRGDS